MQLLLVTEQLKQFELHLSQLAPFTIWPTPVHGSQKVLLPEYELRKKPAVQPEQFAKDPAHVEQFVEQTVQLVELVIKYPGLQVPQVAFRVERYLPAAQVVQWVEVELQVAQLGSHAEQSEPLTKKPGTVQAAQEELGKSRVPAMQVRQVEEVLTQVMQGEEQA